MAARKNIFLAMGFAPEDAMIHALRTDLAEGIAAALQSKKVGQKKAAAMLGLSQAIVSNILNGHTEHVSVERLMRAMVRAKIPGFAYWPTADSARAGVLNVATSAATVSASIEVEADVSETYYGTPLLLAPGTQ